MNASDIRKSLEVITRNAFHRDSPILVTISLYWRIAGLIAAKNFRCSFLNCSSAHPSGDFSFSSPLLSPLLDMVYASLQKISGNFVVDLTAADAIIVT